MTRGCPCVRVRLSSYHGDSGEVGCYVAPRPLTRDNNYFEVRRGRWGSLSSSGISVVTGGPQPFWDPVLVSDPRCRGIPIFTAGPNLGWDAWCHRGSPLPLLSPSLSPFRVPITTRCPRPFVPFAPGPLPSPPGGVSSSLWVAASPFPHRCPSWTAGCGAPSRWGWCRSTTAWSIPPAGCPARWRSTPMTASE